MGCIERLPPLYEVEKGDMWLLTENKAEILYHALRLLIALLSSTSTNAYGFPVYACCCNDVPYATPPDACTRAPTQRGKDPQQKPEQPKTKRE